MLFDDERTLAWALVEAAAPHLSAAQRNDVHVAIGVGESFGVGHSLPDHLGSRRTHHRACRVGPSVHTVARRLRRARR